ncbi:hypothetical protein CHH28_18635 [Bacterioplanes sanyensis]|uniref:HTH araC/xylS-type domain-containing protein n=1 Tax=Bacterioplanes sanyensis TaxID=1249553 RepID=A0A222FP56_9GAMM|nr:AraC family transcriptional regulator [Bacterioplanes sanyensis]ASP40559.1 hypothetical protein CHH28_18635 [Bacterioplanes sanyensis]
MTTVKTVSVLWIKALLMAAQQLGLDSDLLMQRAGLTPTCLSGQTRIGLDKTLRLWRAAEEASPVQDFGLAMGEWVKPAQFQLFALVLLHSKDLNDAFQKTIRYTRILSDGGRFQIVQQGEQAAICYQPQADNFSRHQVDAVMALLRGFADWLACQRIPLMQAEFTHSAPAQIDNYQRIFDCPLVFDQSRNALVFDRTWLDEPLALEDTELAAMHEHMLEQQLQALQAPDLYQQVMAWLQQRDTLDVSRAQLAESLFISERTLQRRLSEQGLSFQEMLDDGRKQRARYLLMQTQERVTDIALQVGLSGSSFTRACHRWFAASPSEVRREGDQSESSTANTSS